MAFLDIPANIVAMRDEVIGRYSSVVLKQVTNDGHINPATANVQNDRIDRAVKDSVGEFEQRCGHEVTLSDESHTAAVAQGVMAFLYSYKGARHETQQQYFLRFVSMCAAIRNASQVESASTNDLDEDPEKSPLDPAKVFPDMSRRYHTHYLPTKRNRPRIGFGDRFGTY